MQIKVWHDKSLSFGLADKPVIRHWPCREYALVALVECCEDTVEKSLETAFRLTNSVDGHWSINEEVLAIVNGRSSSVGDIFEIDGDLWYCDMVGFTKLRDRAKTV